jgi:hypothetical protein
MATKTLPGWIINLIVSLLGPLLAALTPSLKLALTDAVKDLFVKAQESPSPIDDIFVRFLAALLDIELD